MYTTINKSTDHFNTLTWTGDGGTKSFTGVGFEPSFVWSKARQSLGSITGSHFLFDAVRGGGAEKELRSNATGAEGSSANQVYGYVSSFDSDGFTTTAGSSNNDYFNKSSIKYVAWNWKANGQGSSNTDGSINTTYTSVNTTAGFSICKWAGSGANATIGHGLGVAPKMIITKSLATSSWCVYHASLGNTKTIFLESNGTPYTHVAYYNNTSPTSSVFSVGTDDAVNHSGNDMIAYCFAEKTGYSKFGSYTGNGSSSSPAFIYTGFKPKFVMVKNTSQGDGWFIHDDKRDGYNDDNEYLFANLTNAEGTNVNRLSMYSNGFNVPTTDKSHNVSGNSYIYMAFGQSLVGSNNVPCTAR